MTCDRCGKCKPWEVTQLVRVADIPELGRETMRLCQKCIQTLVERPSLPAPISHERKPEARMTDYRVGHEIGRITTLRVDAKAARKNR